MRSYVLCLTLVSIISTPAVAQDSRGFNTTIYAVTIPASAPCIGPSDALVTIVEFSDFECPYCAKAVAPIKTVVDFYKDVRLCFVNLPLKMHANAAGAALAAMAAHRQRKFWPYHRKLFEQQANLGPKTYLKIAVDLGLNIAKFKADLAAPSLKKELKKHIALAVSVNVLGTPAVAVNGLIVPGVPPVSGLKLLVDAQRIKAQAALRTKGVTKKNLYRTLIGLGKSYRPKPYQPIPQVFKVTLKPDTPCIGPRDALLTMVQLTNFSCPFSKKLLPTLATIRKKYGKRLRFCFVHNPEDRAKAHLAAQAAVAANAQGKFWIFHNLLFKHSGEFNRKTLVLLAKKAGLDLAKFKKALTSKTTKNRVQADLELAASIGATGTPFMYINGVQFVGARPLSHFLPVLDELLEDAQRVVKRGVKRSDLYATMIAKGKRIRGPHLRDKVKGLSIEGSPFKGAANAPIIVVEFSDFQCPYCNDVSKLGAQLLKAYPGKVKVVFKHFPLNFHKRATPAAIASMAAHKQGKFWAYRRLLFDNQKALTDANFLKFAKTLKLDIVRFKKDIKDPAIERLVQRDLAMGLKLAIQGTPAIFVNSRPFLSPVGYTFAAFSKIINELIGKK